MKSFTITIEVSKCFGINMGHDHSNESEVLGAMLVAVAGLAVEDDRDRADIQRVAERILNELHAAVPGRFNIDAELSALTNTDAREGGEGK